MIKYIKLNIKMIGKNVLRISGTLYTILTIILAFISWIEIGINSICVRIIILILILLISIVISIIYVCVIKNKVIIWNKGNSAIQECYDDIMKLAFKKNKSENKKIIVVPVNTCFDTIVDDNITNVEKPLVSIKTLHGKWIKGMLENGISINEIDSKISKSLDTQKIKPIYTIPEDEKERGKRKEYERGTIAIVNGPQNNDFFLFALSKFDKNNNAQCSKQEFIDSIHKLIKFYNQNGQGYEMFLPLMGTNLSRVGMSHEEALSIIESSLKLYKDELYGKINIVVYNKEKDKVTIYKD